MMLLQDNTGYVQHDIHLQTIFLGIIAIVMLVSIVVVCIGGAIGLGLLRKAEDMAEKMETRIVPLVDKTCELVTQLGPKIHTLTENVEQISYTVRGKVDELSATVDQLNRTVQEANSRARSQVQRVDGMVSEALSTAQDVSRTVQEGIRRPVHQIAGLIAGVRVGLETLMERSPFFRRGAKETTRPYDV
ncbi:MAG TPA: hypothetical protein VHY48_14545 [Acidobacteriaceae bacterium]|jgi:uncharacterized protein YoxC|nr:hypothetical protein [Acidobacteriaceae bacterium]